MRQGRRLRFAERKTGKIKKEVPLVAELPTYENRVYTRKCYTSKVVALTRLSVSGVICR